jgi:hypothetical protein
MDETNELYQNVFGIRIFEFHKESLEYQPNGIRNKLRLQTPQRGNRPENVPRLNPSEHDDKSQRKT